MKKENFGNRLKLALNLRGMTQTELMNKTGISKSLINKYIKGVSGIKATKLELIANTLNVDPAWLMGYDIPMTSNFESDYKKLNDTQKAIVDNLIKEMLK